MPLDDASAKRYARKSAFLEFCEKDRLSVISGYGVEDLRTAPLKRWERWGGPAAYCHLQLKKENIPLRMIQRAATL